MMVRLDSVEGEVSRGDERYLFNMSVPHFCSKGAALRKIFRLIEENGGRRKILSLRQLFD
jgi:hypothetical protein